MVWKTQGCQIKIASTRIRCLLPALSLERAGFKSVMIEKNESVDLFKQVSILVFVKSFSQHDLKLAMRAKEHGVPIVLDLCDNIFVDEYISPQVKHFKQMAELADLVVCTTDELAGLIREQVINTAVIVIPDQIEQVQNVNALVFQLKVWRDRRMELIENKVKEVLRLYSLKAFRLNNYLHLGRFVYRRVIWVLSVIKYKLSARKTTVPAISGNKKTIIWFGNHGAPYSQFGFTSLCSIQKALEDVNQVVPIRLLVVSNSKKKFDELISGFKIETEYRRWGFLSIFNDIKYADVCVLPVLQDAFSACKSSNRALLALSMGVPVVSTSSSAMNALASFMQLDDFYQGLLIYLTDKVQGQKDVESAQKIIFENFGPSIIRDRWLDVLNKLDIKSPGVSI